MRPAQSRTERWQALARAVRDVPPGRGGFPPMAAPAVAPPCPPVAPPIDARPVQEQCRLPAPSWPVETGEGWMRLLVAAAAGALLLSSGAFAQTTVAGWTIGHDNNGDCQAAYSYKDAEDDNAENSVVISLVEEKGRKVPDVYVILAYEKWDWDKGEETKTEVLVDKKVYASGHSWISPSKNLLISKFVNQLDRFVRAFAEGKKLTIRFTEDDEEAEFNIPDVGQALGAVQYCQANKK
jgi:hypothetical protein